MVLLALDGRIGKSALIPPDFRRATTFLRGTLIARQLRLPIMIDVYPVTVSLNNKTTTYIAAFQTSEQFQKSWQSVLKTAYGRAELRCGCRGRGGRSDLR